MKIGLILFLSIFCISCSTKSLTKLNDDSDCTTSIEGNFFSERIYTGKVPVLFKKKRGNKSLKILGELLEISNDGFLFCPDNKEPFLYKHKDVAALINEKNELIHGKVPDKFLNDCVVTMVIVNNNDPKKQPLEVELEPNKKFGYCISPGEFKVQSILFENEHGFIDQAVGFDTLLINVQKGVNNYIGDIYLDNRKVEGKKIRLPYINKYNPMIGVGSAMFGITGALAASLKPEFNYKSIHVFTVIKNEKFIKNTKRKTITNLIFN